jgi:hypothetical protein
MTTNAELDALIARLRVDAQYEYLEDTGHSAEAADAITALRQERDAARARVAELERVEQFAACSVKAGGDLIAERDAAIKENAALRALLLKSYCYVAAHVPIGVKTDKDRKVLMLDIDAAIDAALSRAGK